MSIALPLIGLGLGALLTASGLALWSGFRRSPALSRPVRAIGWAASALLLAAIPFLWREEAGTPSLVLRLTTMAALATPLIGRRRSLWYDALAYLLPLVLAGASFLLVADLITGPSDAAGSTRPLVAAVLLVGDGLLARTLGQALAALADPEAVPETLFAALYTLLTLAVAGDILTSLWQRGAAWVEIGDKGGLVGAWLAWSAAWLCPRQRPRLRAGLIGLAALLALSLG